MCLYTPVLFKFLIIFRWMDAPATATYMVSIETSKLSGTQEVEQQIFTYLVSEHYAGNDYDPGYKTHIRDRSLFMTGGGPNSNDFLRKIFS